MMSLFPALFAFSLPAIFVLRVTVGIFFLVFGMRLLRATSAIHEQDVLIRTIGYMYGLLKLVTGALLIAGAYTQGVALVGMFLAALTFLQEKNTSANSSSKQVQVLIFVICLSLLFLGPGLFAFDMPL